jgi:hypothetical protein
VSIFVRVVAAVAAVSVLQACQPVSLAPSGATAPAPRPATFVAPSGQGAELPSARSRDLETFYRRIEANLRAQGLLRTDPGTTDAPFSAQDLIRNFEQIALFEEYVNVGGRIVARQTPSQINRWERPILVQLEFGDSVPEARRTRDRISVAAFVTRLSRITGHPMRLVASGGNFHVFMVSEDDRMRLGPRLRGIMPGMSAPALATVIDMPRSTYCLALAWDADEDGAFETAVAVIRAEHPDLLRLSCIHEEMAQGMGLSNDSPEARPSIFNDDEEFALLTPHDEYLLRILYDRRLRPGMKAEEAMPIVRVIAEELLGGTM